MRKDTLSSDRLFEIGNRIEKRNSRKISRSRRIEGKLEKHDLSPNRFLRLKVRARRLSRRIEELEMRRQNILRLLKTKWLNEREGING